ncbi:Ger(x)C family spore germination protein [Alkalihalobacillus deserti]|uniref:Ger(x)C family spore germination protein n=1 Tax=Alkalihalobacillus deserti TaxID=2879466 RepID=UPI001D14609F|nr:Ger(x)C family spore germination protein [Alkalihalobacillus deserti]
MKRTFLLFVILSIFLSLITGCWNRRELNELAIVSGMGFDRSENGYLVSLQIINPRETAAKGEGYDSPVTTYQATGETVIKAVRKITKELPRRAYFSHLRIVIIGNKLAEEGFIDVLDFLSRNHELRTDFYMAISKGESAKDVLATLTSIEKIPANKLYQALEVSEKAWAATGTIQLDELISDLISEGKHPVLTGVSFQGDPQKGKTTQNVLTTDEPVTLQYLGLSVLKNDKLIGWLNEDESKGYNYSQGTVQSTVINVPCSKGGDLGIEVTEANTKTEGKVENGKPKIELEIKVEGSIGDVECKVDLSNTQEIYKIEQKAQQSIKNKIEQAIHKVQKQYKADIFGFGEAIRRSAPKTWKQIKDNWDSEFEDLTVDIAVEVRIRQVGTIGDSILKDFEE